MPILLFDIDGTLVRTGGAGKVAMEAALCEVFGIALAMEEVPYSGRTDLAIGRDLLIAHGIEPTSANQEKLREGYLNRLPTALTKHVGEVCLGIPELIDILRLRDDVLLGLLTGNVRRGAEKKLGHYGLWTHFACGGFGDDCYDRNDVARAAVHAVKSHRGHEVNPNDIWVIGDTPLDVSCARAVGAKVVAVATGWHSIEELHKTGADLVLKNLADTAGVLRALT